MRNRLNRWISLFLVMALTVTTCSLLLAACQTKTEGKDYYNVVYHLNYGDNAERAASVKANTTAIRWRPVREGYIFEDWHTSAELTEENVFDFSTLVDQDLELYAEWSEEPDSFVVSFDFNYYGSAAPVQVAVEENTAIPAEDVPESERMGRTLVGWCKDAQCTQPWNMETDIVTDDITLYADYKFDSTVSRDANGSIIYDNVEVEFWIGTPFPYNDVVYAIVDAFNEEYAGQIKVNASTKLITQETCSLRLQQTPERNLTNTAYHSAGEVYDLAGIEYQMSDWYEQASRDSFVDGRFETIPIVAGVPFVVYNKDLMVRYNGNGTLPDSYDSLCALLEKVYVGESTSNPAFNTFISNLTWTFKEGTAMTAFVQNDAEYFIAEGGSIVNHWEDEAVVQRATIAMKNMYELLSPNGSMHGRAENESEYPDTTVIQRVSQGSAFMGIINCMDSLISYTSEISELGVMPLSGLFASDQTQNKNQIPIHSVGLSFYNASGISNTQLAAAAVFADYMSKNSYAFVDYGWYPVRRSIAESDEFMQSTDPLVAILRQTGDPENFRSLDGYMRGKQIVNSIVSQEYIVPMLASDGSEIEAMISDMVYEFEGNIY